MNAIYNIPANMKKIPPTISYFQDTNRTTNKRNTGMLCMNNPNAQSTKLVQESNTSNENIARNKRNKIDRILGVQNINFLVLFFIALHSIHFQNKCKVK